MPGIALSGAFVEGWHWGRKLQTGNLAQGSVRELDFGQGGFLGFIGNRKTREISVRRKFLLTTLGEEILGESMKISLQGSFNNGVVGLISLDDDMGCVEVTSADAPDDLGEELERAFFGCKIGQGESGVGLNNANGGEMGQVEASSQSLGADEEINVPGFDVGVEAGEIFVLFVIAVETRDFRLGEEASEFAFEQLCPKAFMNHVGLVAFGAARGDFGFVAADMTGEEISIGVQRKG